MNPTRHLQSITQYQTPAQKTAEKLAIDIAVAAVDLISTLKHAYRHEAECGCLSAQLRRTKEADMVSIRDNKGNDIIRYK